MSYTLDPYCIVALWEALSLPPRRGRPGHARSLLADVADRGWAWRCEVDALLFSSDPRLRRWADAETLCEVFGLGWPLVCARSDCDAMQFEGEEALAAVDLALLLMEVERLGFAADAAPLLAALVPALRPRKLLTTHEVAVLWHARGRHRMEALVVQVDAKVQTRAAPCAAPAERLTTATGYEAELRRARDGLPLTLTVHAPEHRAQVEPSRWLH